MDHHVSTDLTDAKLEGGFGKFAIPMMVAGAIATLGAYAFGTGQEANQKQFLHSYLTAFSYFLAIGLGGLFFVILQHLVAASWSITVRRIAECVAVSIPVLAILFLPIVLAVLQKNDALYMWVNPETVAKDHLLQHKSAWLNPTAFCVRALLYFVIWSGIAIYFHRTSVKQDETGDAEITVSQRVMSAPAMILFALSLTFAAFDFIMSLTPHWYSTIFGVYFFASSAMSFMATLALLCKFVQRNGGLKTAISIEHYHDIGKLLFTFVFFWGYISFSQFMLIWYSNIPEETEFFLHRMEGGWLTVSIVLIFAHFLFPFIGMLSRTSKRNRGLLLFWSVWMLTMHYVQMFWLVKHNYDTHHVAFGLLDVLCMVGIGGLFIGNILRVLGGNALTPVKEPRLAKSLAFHNI